MVENFKKYWEYVYVLILCIIKFIDLLLIVMVKVGYFFIFSSI